MGEQADVNIKFVADTNQARAEVQSLDQIMQGVDANLEKADEQRKARNDEERTAAAETRTDAEEKGRRLGGYVAAAAAAVVAVKQVSDALRKAADEGDVFAKAQVESMAAAEDAANRMWVAIGQSALGRGALVAYQEATSGIEKLVRAMERLTEEGRTAEEVNERMGRAVVLAGKMSAESMGRAADEAERLTQAMGEANAQAEMRKAQIQADADIARAGLTSEGAERIKQEWAITQAAEQEVETQRQAEWDRQMAARKARNEKLRQEIAIQEKLAMADAEAAKAAAKLRGELGTSVDGFNAEIDAEGPRRFKAEKDAEVKEAQYKARLREAEKREAEAAARSQAEEAAKNEQAAEQRQRTLQGLRGGLGAVLSQLPNPAAMGLDADTAGLDEILKAVQKLLGAMQHNKTVTDQMRRQIQTLARQAEQAKLADAAGG
jgi:hypothetical protein